MTEITQTDASKLSLDDARTLVAFADWEPYGLTSDLTMQGVLDLYHASSEYISLGAWLQEGDDAEAHYDIICNNDMLRQAA